jgi:hydroxysqualene dehydroxylase
MVDQHTPPLASKPDVVVLGGGISGIAAAIYLLDQGYSVTLIEARRFLGGRVFSFADAETGVPVDNGQHVIVGCCSYFIDFLKSLGISDRWYLQPRLRLRVLNRRGKEGLLAASRLPGPFHLLPAFLAYPHLGTGDKIRAVIALARAKFTDRCQPYLERMTFYQWLKQQGQSERAIQNLWNLLVMPTLNDDVREVSASMGLMIVQEGMVEGCHSADVGYAADGLLAAVGEPAKGYLSAKGARLLLGCSVRRLCLESGGVKGVELASGDVITGGAYVSALPFSVLLEVLPRDVAEQPFFQRLNDLETSPIVNIHLWYDRPVMDGDFCALVDSPLQWVFNKSAILGGGYRNDTLPSTKKVGAGLKSAPTGQGTVSLQPDLSPSSEKETDQGQYICISISAAWDYIDQTREELTRQFIDQMAEVFPRAREAKVKRSIVVKQRHATFRCLPGANELRPGSQTPIANLFLAGEWTDTGWPSTMESAVRSGYNAAQTIIQNNITF